MLVVLAGMASFLYILYYHNTHIALWVKTIMFIFPPQQTSQQNQALTTQILSEETFTKFHDLRQSE